MQQLFKTCVDVETVVITKGKQFYFNWNFIKFWFIINFSGELLKKINIKLIVYCVWYLKF